MQDAKNYEESFHAKIWFSFSMDYVKSVSTGGKKKKPKLHCTLTFMYPRSNQKNAKTTKQIMGLLSKIHKETYVNKSNALPKNRQET